MWNKRKCGCKPHRGLGTYGPMLIALGIGLILAYIIPYYILIILLGIGLVVAGVVFLRK